MDWSEARWRQVRAWASVRDPYFQRLPLETGAYAGLAAYSANSAAARRGDPTMAPRVALVFPVLHASYGIGTIVGAGRTLWARRGR